MTIRIRKKLRKLFTVLSFSSVFFIFQACYGTPRDIDSDVYIEGLIKAKSNNQPIPGIKVSIDGKAEYGITDVAGKFKFYTLRNNEYKLKYEDTDSLKDGSYLPGDTILKISGESAFLEILMNER